MNSIILATSNIPLMWSTKDYSDEPILGSLTEIREIQELWKVESGSLRPAAILLWVDLPEFIRYSHQELESAIYLVNMCRKETLFNTFHRAFVSFLCKLKHNDLAQRESSIRFRSLRTPLPELMLRITTRQEVEDSVSFVGQKFLSQELLMLVVRIFNLHHLCEVKIKHHISDTRKRFRCSFVDRWLWCDSVIGQIGQGSTARNGWSL